MPSYSKKKYYNKGGSKKSKKSKKLKKSKRFKKIYTRFEHYNNINNIDDKTLKELNHIYNICFNNNNNISSTMYTNLIRNTKNNDVISFLQYDKKNNIWNLCTPVKYRKKGYAKKIILNTIKKINKFNQYDKNVYLYVDKLKDSYPKLISYYKNLNFKELYSDLPDKSLLVYKNI